MRSKHEAFATSGGLHRDEVKNSTKRIHLHYKTRNFKVKSAVDCFNPFEVAWNMNYFGGWARLENLGGSHQPWQKVSSIVSVGGG